MTNPDPTPRRETDDAASAPCAAVVAATLAQTTDSPERANPNGNRPAIYVACLAAYNSGILHGAWIWAEDADDMRAATSAMLARSPEPGAEEWAIHDFAGFEGARIEAAGIVFQLSTVVRPSTPIRASPRLLHSLDKAKTLEARIRTLIDRAKVALTTKEAPNSQTRISTILTASARQSRLTK